MVPEEAACEAVPVQPDTERVEEGAMGEDVRAMTLRAWRYGDVDERAASVQNAAWRWISVPEEHRHREEHHNSEPTHCLKDFVRTRLQIRHAQRFG